MIASGSGKEPREPVDPFHVDIPKEVASSIPTDCNNDLRLTLLEFFEQLRLVSLEVLVGIDIILASVVAVDICPKDIVKVRTINTIHVAAHLIAGLTNEGTASLILLPPWALTNDAPVVWSPALSWDVIGVFNPHDVDYDGRLLMCFCLSRTNGSPADATHNFSHSIVSSFRTVYSRLRSRPAKSIDAWMVRSASDKTAL